MDALYDIREMVCTELDEIARKGELSAGSLETVHKLTDILKNTYKIEMLSEGEENSYGMGDWEARGTYGRNTNSHNNGSYRGNRRSMDEGDSNSYARNRHYVRGHYSYAEAADIMTKKLDEMMKSTDDAEIKEILERAKKKIEKV